MAKFKVTSLCSPVAILIFGTFLVGAAQSALTPFLTIYLITKTSLGLPQIGLIVGAAPLAGIFGGIIGGYLSDNHGKKRMLLLSLLITIIATLGLALSKEAWILIVINSVCGLARNAFNPIAHSMLIDLVPEEQRVTILSYDNTALNSGYVVGMFIGSILIRFSSPLIFIFTSSITALFFVLVITRVRETHRIVNYQEGMLTTKKIGLISTFSLLFKDSVLLWITFGGIMFNMAYTQITTSIPVHMENMWNSDGVVWYSNLILLNTIIVIFFQILFSKYLDKRNPYKVLMISTLFGIASFLIFGINQLWIYIIAVLLLTIAELISFVGIQKSSLDISNDSNRGTYFGFRSVPSLGNSLGNISGMLLLNYFSGRILFMFCAMFFVFSFFSYLMSFNQRNKRLRQTESLPI